jgi:diadenosine tetraphosphate (Ap4A) HIT family hydrolase
LQWSRALSDRFAMPTIFTKIINGEIPGRFIYKDDLCVSFLTIAPLQPGHVLVVPRAEIDHWIDLPTDLAAHLISVAQRIARAIQAEFQPRKVGLSIIGLEVPHVHIHLVPIREIRDMQFGVNEKPADPDELDEVQHRLIKALEAYT